MTRPAISASNLWLTLILCPLLAAGDTVIKALAIGVVAAIAMALSAMLAGILRERLASATALACGLLVGVALVTAELLLLQAWLYDLNSAMFVLLPLLAVNPGVLMPWLPTQDHAPTSPSMRNVAAALLCLAALAMAREIVGRGALFSDTALLSMDWAQSWQLTFFRLDRGFLLALLAPGAFISLGLALAARNWLRQHHAPSP